MEYFSLLPWKRWKHKTRKIGIMFLTSMEEEIENYGILLLSSVVLLSSELKKAGTFCPSKYSRCFNTHSVIFALIFALLETTNLIFTVLQYTRIYSVSPSHLSMSWKAYKYILRNCCKILEEFQSHKLWQCWSNFESG